jgi:hypothetical protein
VEADVAALSRRIMLMEEEAKKSEQNLADTVTKLALSSKEADQVLKKVKVFESKCMNNEVTIEELDKNLRATTKMASDNEQKLDELSRKLGVQVMTSFYFLTKKCFFVFFEITNLRTKE